MRLLLRCHISLARHFTCPYIAHSIHSWFVLLRSTTNIVKAAQKVISNPSNALSPQDSVRQDMKPMRGKGPSPRILACADAKAEGEQ